MSCGRGKNNRAPPTPEMPSARLGPREVGQRARIARTGGAAATVFVSRPRSATRDRGRAAARRASLARVKPGRGQDNVRSGALRHWRARSGYGMVAGDVEDPSIPIQHRRAEERPRALRRRYPRQGRRSRVQALRLRPGRGRQPLGRDRRRALRQGFLAESIRSMPAAVGGVRLLSGAIAADADGTRGSRRARFFGYAGFTGWVRRGVPGRARAGQAPELGRCPRIGPKACARCDPELPRLPRIARRRAYSRSAPFRRKSGRHPFRHHSESMTMKPITFSSRSRRSSPVPLQCGKGSN